MRLCFSRNIISIHAEAQMFRGGNSKTHLIRARACVWMCAMENGKIIENVIQHLIIQFSFCEQLTVEKKTKLRIPVLQQTHGISVFWRGFDSRARGEVSHSYKDVA